MQPRQQSGLNIFCNGVQQCCDALTEEHFNEENYHSKTNYGKPPARYRPGGSGSGSQKAAAPLVPRSSQRSIRKDNDSKLVLSKRSGNQSNGSDKKLLGDDKKPKMSARESAKVRESARKQLKEKQLLKEKQEEDAKKQEVLELKQLSSFSIKSKNSNKKRASEFEKSENKSKDEEHKVKPEIEQVKFTSNDKLRSHPEMAEENKSENGQKAKDEKAD